MRSIRMYSSLFSCVLVGLLTGCTTPLEDELEPPTVSGSVMDMGSQRCLVGQTTCMDGVQFICQPNGLLSATGMDDACAEVEDVSCADALANRSYIGCEYWPVDLDNAIEIAPPLPAGPDDCQFANSTDVWVYEEGLELCVAGQRTAGLCREGRSCPNGYNCQASPACILNAQYSNFTVVVSNPSTTQTATVTLKTPGGDFLSQPVEPGRVAKLEPYKMNARDASIDGTSSTRSAFQLISTSPIVAYQFNPLDNEGVFSNDGSLLLPTHAMDSLYLVMSLPTLNRDQGRAPMHSYHGYVAIVGVEIGDTEIEVIPSADIRAGPNQMELAAREPHRFFLSQGEVLNLEAAGNGDLTGTRIEALDSEKKIAVYSGHEATVITDRPSPQTCCADHVEEQLFPLQTWGDRFAVARSAEREDPGRGEPAPDLIRVLASSGDTEIAFDPPVEGDGCGRLVAGAYCDVFIYEDTEITATAPILVGQILLSIDGSSGDPALALVPPVAQYRSDYTFLVPSEYADQYISVVGVDGSTVELNGQDLSGQMEPFGTGLAGGRFRMQPGSHTLECSNTCGLVVYGYDAAVSYMFAGGLDLEPIVLF